MMALRASAAKTSTTPQTLFGRPKIKVFFDDKPRLGVYITGPGGERRSGGEGSPVVSE